MERLKLIDDYWTDDRGNMWSADKYTYDAAQEFAWSLSSSNNCIDCEHCIRCSGCVECTYCTNCEDCTNCNHCAMCTECTDCGGCEGCSQCLDCRRCGTSANLRHCLDCEMCKNFRFNPQRYVGRRLGKTSPVVYWYGRRVLYTEGGFRGTLKQFERHIADRYKNEGKNYRKLIAFIETAKQIIRKDKEDGRTH